MANNDGPLFSEMMWRDGTQVFMTIFLKGLEEMD